MFDSRCSTSARAQLFMIRQICILQRLRRAEVHNWAGLCMYVEA